MKTCVKNVRIIDGNGNCIENGNILFDENSIIEMSTTVLDGADIVIDGNGCTILPGLIDCHVHLAMDCYSKNSFETISKDNETMTGLKIVLHGQQFLEAGITTVRNMGTKFDSDITYRNMVNNKIITGPRVIASGLLLTMTGGHGNVIGIECDTPDEAKKAARLQIKKGADVIKLIATGGVLTPGTEIGAPQLSEKEMRAVCIEAKQMCKTTAAHSIGISGTKNAIRAGVTSIEHGYCIDDEAIKLMIENNTYLVPTIIAPISMIRNEKDSNDQFTVTAIKKAIPLTENHKIVFKKALNAGIKIATGTDQGTPHNYPGVLIEEIALFVEYGMTNMQALVAATKISAECLGISNIVGTLEKDKLADMIMIKGNPLDDIFTLRNVVNVYRDGVKIVSNK